MERMKAQAEMALVLGLVAVAVIVIIYAYSTFTYPVPGGTTSEQKGAEAFVRDDVIASARGALMKIYSQGGYYDIADAQKTVKFAGADTAYWQICNDVKMPDIKEQVEKGVRAELLSRLPEKTNLGGRQIVLRTEQLDVKASVHENKVSLEINLPTKVDGVDMPQPYRLEIDSKLGRIYNFAKDFASFERKYRVIDYGLMQHINISNPDETEEGTCWLPTDGIITSTLRRTWQQTAECMESQITHTLSHTYEWEKPWLNADGDIPPELLENLYIFQIQKLDGSWGQYADLDMEFYYGGDGRHLTKSDGEFYLRTDPDPIVVRPWGLPGVMAIGYYTVDYDVAFPVVLSVRDSVLKKNFNFAVFVNIRNSAPSNEKCMEAAPPSPEELQCADVGAHMHLTVSDTNGHPLPGVYMSFGQCIFDSPSNSDGTFSFATPNLDDSQVIGLYDKATNTEYNISATAEELRNGMNVRMPLNTLYTLHIYTAGYTDPSNIYVFDRAQKIDIKFTMNNSGNDAMDDLVYETNNKYDIGSLQNTLSNNIDPNNIDPKDFEAEPPNNELLITLPANATYNVNITIEDADSQRTKDLEISDFHLDKNKRDIYIYVPHISMNLQGAAVVFRNRGCGFDVMTYKSPEHLSSCSIFKSQQSAQSMLGG